jgi:hypothetical protein
LEYEPQKLGMRSGYKKQNNLFADLVNFWYGLDLYIKSQLQLTIFLLQRP